MSANHRANGFHSDKSDRLGRGSTRSTAGYYRNNVRHSRRSNTHLEGCSCDTRSQSAGGIKSRRQGLVNSSATAATLYLGVLLTPSFCGISAQGGGPYETGTLWHNGAIILGTKRSIRQDQLNAGGGTEELYKENFSHINHALKSLVGVLSAVIFALFYVRTLWTVANICICILFCVSSVDALDPCPDTTPLFTIILVCVCNLVSSRPEAELPNLSLACRRFSAIAV